MSGSDFALFGMVFRNHGFEEESPGEFEEGSLERLLSCMRHRADHVAVTWKDKTIIWGGSGSGTEWADPHSGVYSIYEVTHQNGECLPLTLI